MDFFRKKKEKFLNWLRSLKFFFYHHSIKEGIFYPLVILFILGFSVSVYLLYFGGNYLLKKEGYHQLNVNKIQFMTELKDERRALKQLVILLAHDQTVKNYIVRGDKKGLEEYTFTILNKLREEGGSYSLNINFNLSSIFNSKNDTMVSMVNKIHNMTDGLEMDKGEIKIKAAAPIVDVTNQDKMVCLGVVEASLSLKEFVKKIRSDPNEGIIVFLAPKFRQRSYVTNINFDSDLLSTLKQSLEAHQLRGQKGHYLFASFELPDFKGQKIATVIFLKDIKPLLQERNIVLLILSFMFFLAYLITIATIYGNINQITEKITDLKQSIISALKGNFSHSVPLSFKIQCWEMLNCNNTSCPVYKDDKKVCFLVTGDFAFGSPYRGTCAFLKKFGSCQNCPVMIKRTRNELSGAICWYNSLFDTLFSFFTRINKKLSEMLNITQEEYKESLIVKVDHIVNEMLNLTHFRKTLESFENKEEIYNYFKWTLISHFKVKNFIIFEVNNSENRFEVMVNEAQEFPNKIFPDLLIDCNLCPVKRNGRSLSSLEYANICDYSYIDHQRFFHYCLPIMMGGHVGAVLKVVVPKSQKNDFLSNVPFLKKYSETLAPILEARRALAVTKQQALRDQLTGLYNRRFMEEYINKWDLILKRTNSKVSVLMLDIDHFKRVNDTYGHYTGDIVLKKIAFILKSNLRGSDWIFRYGGEEILIFLPDVNKEGAINVAEKLRRAVETAEFTSTDQNKFKITISIGVATYPEDSDNLKEVIKLADKALYVAKHQGRNKVVAYKPQIWHLESAQNSEAKHA